MRCVIALGAMLALVACRAEAPAAPVAQPPVTFSREAVASQAMQYLRPLLLDADSAHITSALVGDADGHIAFCGEVVARNQLGGMTTPKAYIVVPSTGFHMIEGPTTDYQMLGDTWEAYCPH